MNFYLSKDGQRLGPYSVQQIQIFLRQGLITVENEVWAEGWSAWAQIRNVPNLAGANSTDQQIQPVPVPTPVQAQQQFPSAYVEGKEPVIACVLSLFIVGSGQAYNGEWAKGAFLLVTCVVAAWFSCGTFWLVWALVSAIDAYRVAAKLKTANNWNWWS